MKTIITLVTLLCFTGTAQAADEWTKVDTAYQAVFIGLTIADWNQTKRFVKMGHRESNPILGETPSQNRIDCMIGSSIIAHTAIAYALPKKWRRVWQCIWIGIEGWAVHHNYYNCGIKIKF